MSTAPYRDAVVKLMRECPQLAGEIMADCGHPHTVTVGMDVAQDSSSVSVFVTRDHGAYRVIDEFHRWPRGHTGK